MDLQELAVRMLKDYDAHCPGSMFQHNCTNLTVDDAYALQFEVAALREARGEQVAGYKIGCISNTMQRQLGIDKPVFGHIWNTEVFNSGVELAPQQFDGLAIEGELAVRVNEDVPSPAWLKNNPQAVAGHHAVIELHNYVFRGPESIRAVELIANNAIHAGVVLAKQELPMDEFAPNTAFTVDRNSDCLGEGTVDHLKNGPDAVVAAVAEHLEQYGQHLKRDQIILTGSPLPLWRLEPGDHISVTFGESSTVSCSVATQNHP